MRVPLVLEDCPGRGCLDSDDADRDGRPIASNTDAPTGDVWITPEAPSPTPTAQQNLAHRPLPTGDFWPAEDDPTRAADAPAPPHDQSAARDEVAARAVK